MTGEGVAVIVLAVRIMRMMRADGSPPGVRGQRGGFAAGRLSPIHKNAGGRTGFNPGAPSANGRTVFPPFLSIYRTMKPSRQGRSDRRPGHLISC